jgi:hypothetical protein
MSQGKSITQNLELSGATRGLPAKWDGRMTFSVPEAGEILGLSRGSAYAAAAAGTLPVIRFGKRELVTRPTLERILGLAP